MDDRKAGAVIRELRRRKRWRQRDVGDKAHVSQQLVSLVELGRFEAVGLDKARAVAKALDATIELTPRWRGPELDRLLDAGHAALVEQVVGALQAVGWEVVVEWTFNHYGERGSIDVVGWREATRTLVVIEVKTRVVDLQDLLASTDRKARVATKLLPDERGWRPRSVGRLLVLPMTSTAHDALRRHGATLASAFQARTRAIRRWLSAPDGPISGVWLIRPTNSPGAPGGRTSPSGPRVRPPRSTGTDRASR